MGPCAGRGTGNLARGHPAFSLTISCWTFSWTLTRGFKVHPFTRMTILVQLPPAARGPITEPPEGMPPGTGKFDPCQLARTWKRPQEDCSNPANGTARTAWRYSAPAHIPHGTVSPPPQCTPLPGRGPFVFSSRRESLRAVRGSTVLLVGRAPRFPLAKQRPRKINEGRLVKHVSRTETTVLVRRPISGSNQHAHFQIVAPIATRNYILDKNLQPRAPFTWRGKIHRPGPRGFTRGTP